jgi:hypothetical protein
MGFETTSNQVENLCQDVECETIGFLLSFPGHNLERKMNGF